MRSERVLDIFKEITRIPRESGHEGPVTEWLCAWAKDRGLQYKSDATGNVLIIREAAPGKGSVPTIVLQAHQDMVCEKLAGFKFDFRKDPIPYVIKDGWMVAENTTLGADDGIGIAACLAAREALHTWPEHCPSALELALHGGDDYELAFTAPPATRLAFSVSTP